MKTRIPSAFSLRPLALAALAAFALFTTALPAPGQSGWGSALSFDGVDDYVQSQQPVDLANRSFSVEAWAQRRSSNSMDMIVTQGNGGAGTSLMFGFHWFGFDFDFYGDGVSITDVDTAWHHWAGTYDASTQLRCLYRDGMLVASNVALQNYQGSGPLSIGRATFDDPANFDGGIDEVRIWNVARSQVEIQENMLRPLSGSEANLLAYWKFDEGAGTIAHDATTNHLDGTLINGPSWITSPLPRLDWGSALSFDGVNDYVTFSRPVADDFTLECWFRTTQTFGSGSGHWWDGAGLVDGEVNGGVHDFGLSLGAGKVLFGTGGSVDLTIRSPNTVADGQWHHVAATRQKSNGAMQLFVDGSLVASGANASGVSLDLPTQLRLGSLASGVNFFSGQIDEVRIWNQVRSVDQIREGMCHPLTDYGSGLVAYYRLDEETGTIAFDATANHFNGTLVNGPVWTGSTIPAFVNFNAGLPGISWGSAAWGDYDNDGRLDVILAGAPDPEWPSDRFRTQLWRNNGSGFTYVPIAGLPQTSRSSVAWGDYDNDGRLDFLLAGSVGSGNQIAQVWRNTGSGFININAGLPGVDSASVAWGDYDNDGHLDILLTGLTENPKIAQVWRNNGDGTFRNINAPLPGVYEGSVAWGDYDRDGRLDILLSGRSDWGPITQLWRNTGSGFTNVPITIPGVRRGAVAWGDYDNDGFLDILVTGLDNTPGAVAQLWRNTGSSFLHVPIPGFPAVWRSSAAWGDYDNDGLLDIVIAGATDPHADVPLTQIWRNTGTGFTNISAPLPPMRYSSVAWGDLNSDGRLDILLAGQDVGTNALAQVWRNITPVVNSAPAAPRALTAAVVGRQVALGWAASTDGQTPANGLSYNLRVGTSPGACNVISPQANLTNALRLLSARGNAHQSLTALLTNLSEGRYYWSVQAVDTAFAGSPFAAEADFLVYPPQVQTTTATDVTSTGATLQSVVNPMEWDTVAWFEYGLTTKYGSRSTATSIGNGPEVLPVSIPIGSLLPWMSYHYRAVASNSVGVTVGADMTFTLSGPSTGTLSLSPLSDVTLPQGGSTSVGFTALPAGVGVQVRCNNPVLLPATGLILSGSGTGYTLGLVPDPLQSGSAQITVIASDGTRAVTQTFTLTVTPLASDPARLLYLTPAQPVSPEAWQFRIVDFGTASTNYAVEYRSHLSPTNTWVPATNVTDLTGGLYQVDTGPPQRDTGFYRVRGIRWLTAGLDSPATVVDEGAASGAVIVFNGVFTGDVTYSWGGTQGTITGTNWVNGTTAVIPIPASFVSDNARIDALRYLTLRLGTGPGFALAGVTESSITIEEDDADWQGVLQTASGSLSFVLTIQQTNHSFLGQLKSDGSGFFPTNALAQLTFTENTFTAVATNIPLPALAGSPLFGASHRVDLRLDAANGQTNQSVSPTQIQGVATMVTVVPGLPHLDTAVQGTFLVLRPPTTPSTNEVPLYPAR